MTDKIRWRDWSDAIEIPLTGDPTKESTVEEHIREAVNLVQPQRSSYITCGNSMVVVTSYAANGDLEIWDCVIRRQGVLRKEDR